MLLNGAPQVLQWGEPGTRMNAARKVAKGYAGSVSICRHRSPVPGLALAVARRTTLEGEIAKR
jgi:hypothetical protein